MGWLIEAAGGPEAFERLARGLPATELWSLVMEVARARARARTPRQVREQYARDLFVRPAAVDQRTMVSVDAELLEAAAGFEALELSPVAPLAACSSFALTDQHRVLAALRGTEVVADPTNVLALECAERLQRAAGDAATQAPVRLTTSMRVIRAQALPKPTPPGFAPHFRIWVLASGGREAAAHATTVDALGEHITTMLTALDRLEATGAYAFGARRVELLATPERAVVGDRIAARLAEGHPALAVTRGRLDHAYYSGGVRYRLWVTAPDGSAVPLGDGGAFDWLARLLAHRGHVYVASGLGAQLVPIVFRRTSADAPAAS